MKERKGISLIVLVITIIVMIIIAGAIILSLSETNIIDQAENAVRLNEEGNIKDALLISTVFTDTGAVDKDATYNSLKSSLGNQVTVGTLQEDGTFTVEGKYDTYTLKISDFGVEMTPSGGQGGNTGTPETPNEDETSEQFWIDTYEAVQYIGTNNSIKGVIDGNGTWTQTVKMEGQSEESNTVLPYEFDGASKTLTLDVSSLGQGTAVVNLYNLGNNKALELNLGGKMLLTTNGLSGLKADDLSGKTYSYTDPTSNETVKLVFTTDYNANMKKYDSSGQETENRAGVYFKLPSYIVNNEDKIIITNYTYLEFSVERDAEGNIIKLTDSANNITYTLED